jgi:hypothetical protein
MECAFQKDLSLVYKVPEPCLVSCHHSDEVAAAGPGYIVYLIVSVVVIVVLAVGGFTIYYYRIIRPNLGEKETLIDWLRRRRKRDCDRRTVRVRNNVSKGARPVVRQLSSHALFNGSLVFLSLVAVQMEITTRSWAALRITAIHHQKEIVKLPMNGMATSMTM